VVDLRKRHFSAVQSPRDVPTGMARLVLEQLGRFGSVYFWMATVTHFGLTERPVRRQ